MGIFRQNRGKPAARAPVREPPVFEAPVMDRELPLAMLAAAVAAIVLVGVQVHSSSAAQRKEATSRPAYSAAQHRPEARLASSQPAFEQRVR